MIRGRNLVHSLALALPMVGAFASAACGTGDVPDPGMRTFVAPTAPDVPVPTTAVANAVPVVGETMVRRLNRREFDRTLSDLLGADVIASLPSAPSANLPADAWVDGFDTNASALKVNPQFVEQVMLAADAVSDAFPTSRSGCTESVDEDACIGRFVVRFGGRAWRRPLTDDERVELQAFWRERRDEEGFDGSVRALVARFVQSPYFLYRVEVPVPDASPRALANRSSRATGTVPSAEPERPPTRLVVDSFAMASRLSYLLWQSMPDDALFARAERDELRDPAVVRDEAERMMKDARARETLGRFHAEWLGTDGLDTTDKVASTYPEFASLRAALKRESELFVDGIVIDGPGDLASLFTSTTVWVNAATAPLYGLEASDATFVRAELDGTKRAGVLTRVPHLARLGKADRSAPILRGVFLRDRVLCQPFDPPPPNATDIPKDSAGATTTRELFASLTSGEKCQTCHKDINALGFGFENYDAVGRWRTAENDRPVDATGTLDLGDLQGAYDGAVELSSRLATSERVRACFTKQWFRFGYGRSETSGDGDALHDLEARFAASGHRIPDLVVALTQSPLFFAPSFSSGPSGTSSGGGP
ncbi:MAG: DUF1592 domain-containing protein [Polyangiaceae bacterium]